ncbi:MAG: TIM barrel protein [Victivallales bacterium]
MVKFTPCADIFFNDQPLLKRLALLAEIGFDRYEMWSWWNKDGDAITRACREYRIELAACCTHFVSLTDPAERQKYCDGLSETIEFCRKHGCRTIISQVGNELPGVPRKMQHDSLVVGLQQAARLLKNTGMQLVIEPLNLLVDHAGYYLSRSDEAAEVLRKVDSENVKMLFDIYHQQITEGNVIANLRQYAPLIGHYHVADVPGRHEPGTGELNYANIFAAIASTGYDGNIGLEFFPANPEHQATLCLLRKKIAGVDGDPHKVRDGRERSDSALLLPCSGLLACRMASQGSCRHQQP